MGRAVCGWQPFGSAVTGGPPWSPHTHLVAKPSANHGLCTPGPELLSTVNSEQAFQLSSVLQIVELLNIIYCIAQLVEFAAFVTLRFREPDLHRWEA